MQEIWDILPGLGDKLAAHVVLAASAIALAMLIALPMAVWAGRSRTVSRIALSLASLVQTIPALALLALFFPLLLSLRSVFGEGLPTLGFLPALMALTLYALLPILRNAVTAQANLDEGVLKAADGVGMTKWQKLVLVEAPLSAPFIMAGIRTASVWTIGAATLATTIGQPSLGDPIFAGLQTQNWALVLAGCLASAGLALAADNLLWVIEVGLARRKRWMTFGGMAIVVLGICAALWGQRTDETERPIVIAAKQFSEQYILAQLIGSRLEAAGYRVEYRDGLGSAVVHSAVASSSVDISVDYTGTIWANFLKRADNPGREAMYETIREWELRENGVKVLGRLGFENAYAFAMRPDRAKELGVTNLADLVGKGGSLTVGGDPEFFERPEWLAVRDAYGLRFGRTRNFAPTFMYDALRSGEADVISAYTSDGRIAADKLVVLADPRGALPSYDALLLLSPRIADDPGVAAALQPLLGAISVEAMREANFEVDREDAGKLTPPQAAEQLAKRTGLEK
ncbi:MAG: ABC transporter permease/substrate-binding protein [Erythrobacter sp.]|uniref:ABC transporter permease/substrate-binding protein n=1 Tax=Erythrobacter sp. TaxID=1042 RepID=UPI0025DE4826|nr:ABC transporter permease/substrate-binding protein [Erythrobacter sp.]MCL9998959.1 ABC transporter permease/substrate-binding protein [Erythrobacter sp.]